MYPPSPRTSAPGRTASLDHSTAMWPDGGRLVAVGINLCQPQLCRFPLVDDGTDPSHRSEAIFVADPGRDAPVSINLLVLPSGQCGPASGQREASVRSLWDFRTSRSTVERQLDPVSVLFLSGVSLSSVPLSLRNAVAGIPLCLKVVRVSATLKWSRRRSQSTRLQLCSWTRFERGERRHERHARSFTIGSKVVERNLT